MEENNRKGPGVFYAVMGVATLVVAIIGATFAYFTASATVTGDSIEGTTATGSNASVTVAKVTPGLDATTNGKMVPLLDGTSEIDGMTEDKRATALSKSCVDTNGYVACQVYSVTVKNEGAEGSDTIYVSTNLQLTTDEGLSNMRWQVIDSATALGEGTPVTTHTTASPIKLTEALAAQAEKTYYVMVWLSDTGIDQPLEAGKSYTGAVTANIVNVNGQNIGSLTATFTE